MFNATFVKVITAYLVMRAILECKALFFQDHQRDSGFTVKRRSQCKIAFHHILEIRGEKK